MASPRELPPPSVELRPATEDDRDFVLSLGESNLRALEEAPTVTLDVARRGFDPLVDQIVVIDGEDAGVVAVERGPDDIHLRRMELLPEWQHHGVGTLLVNALLEEARGEGVPVTLRVLKNDPARRFYGRMGFAVTGATGPRLDMRWRPR